ncbi:MAG: hypothetical protein KKH44_10205 [Bacteroidetes bacterium]|nr:hypothetical protein [Bacteroidota bacterium]
MKNLIKYLLLLGVISIFSTPLYSQNKQVTGKYQLLHNIPKHVFEGSRDSIFEFPVFIHQEIIELKKNEKARITIIQADNKEEIKNGSWIQTGDIIEIKLENAVLIFRIVSIENKPHLKLENSEFKYYEKY